MHCKDYMNSFDKDERIFNELVKNMSYKEKMYITPRALMESLNCSEKRCEEILNELTDKIRLKRKFVFECNNQNCLEDVVVYQEEMDDIITCEECENEIYPKKAINLLKDVAYEVIQEKDKLNNNMYGTDYNKFFSRDIDNVVDISKYNRQNLRLKGDTTMINKKKKIFISHNEKDKGIVTQLVSLLRDMGIPRSKEFIFCSSQQGLGVDMGTSIPQYIKEEFDEEMIVLFMFSKNYFNSTPCLCEMGAAWVKAKAYIPIIIPPFEFEGIEGFIDKNVKGTIITDVKGLNEFKDKIRYEMNINEDINDTWEDDRSHFIEKIQSIIEKDKLGNLEK